MYRPLPKELTIKNSKIEGLGLFATKKIKKNSFIGLTHIRDEMFEGKYIRTPLGGFYNHSKDSNIMKMLSDVISEKVDFEYNKKISLFSNQFIDKLNSKLFEGVNEKNEKNSLHN